MAAAIPRPRSWKPIPLTGEQVEVLWVKGSGGDIGSIGMDGFATLYMDKLRALRAKYRGVAHEDEMVGYLPPCTFGLNPRAASIDTPLHAYVLRRHVDHVHSDAIIAIAASVNSRDLTRQIFGDEIGWLPWKKPGYELGLWLEKFATENPQAKGCVLESHGLFTWADDAKDCYLATLAIINKAAGWLDRTAGDKPTFGGAARLTLPAAQRRDIAARLMPAIRGLISRDRHKVGHFDDQPAVLDFVGSQMLDSLAPLGHPAPTIFCAPRSARWSWISTPRGPILMPPLPGWKRPSPPIVRIMPPATIAASTPTARPCAIPTQLFT